MKSAAIDVTFAFCVNDLIDSGTLRLVDPGATIACAAARFSQTGRHDSNIAALGGPTA